MVVSHGTLMHPVPDGFVQQPPSKAEAADVVDAYTRPACRRPGGESRLARAAGPTVVNLYADHRKTAGLVRPQEVRGIRDPNCDLTASTAPTVAKVSITVVYRPPCTMPRPSAPFGVRCWCAG
jgi:hypothetical protein